MHSRLLTHPGHRTASGESVLGVRVCQHQARSVFREYIESGSDHLFEVLKFIELDAFECHAEEGPSSMG